jgi:Fe-S cluster assembly scaffold protein SufB
MEQAEKARKTAAKLGPDIDVSKFEHEAPECERIKSPSELPKEIQEGARIVGINPDEEKRSGTFFQRDQSVIYACARPGMSGVEIMSTTEALEKHDWLKDYWWKAVAVDSDKYTALAELEQKHGYFIRSLPGSRLDVPVQACLYIGRQGVIQKVHNMIIAEEDSELHIITGCTTHPGITSGMHIGISEFYVKKGATITFTMIHGWAPEVEVRPRTGAIVEEGGTFFNNYICFRPVHTLQMYPTAQCVGENSRARYHTLIYGSKDSIIDVGSRAILKAKGARAEVTSRIIAKDSSRTYARGHLVGEAPETRAHLDCRGLMLSSEAVIYSIPELEARVEGTDLSHEAAVGKIEEEQLYYLMSRGLTEDKATALIVRGFLDPEIPGLPEHLQNEVRKAVQLTAEKAL